MSSALESILENYKSIIPKITKEVHIVLTKKMKMWQKILWEVKLKICYCLQELINNITPMFIQYGENLLFVTLRLILAIISTIVTLIFFRLSTSFNNLLQIDEISNKDRSIICNNSCSYLIFPLRKISITRLLQIIASNRAELCCHILIDCLLDTYRLYDISDDENGSDNSSLEIYM